MTTLDKLAEALAKAKEELEKKEVFPHSIAALAADGKLNDSSQAMHHLKLHEKYAGMAKNPASATYHRDQATQINAHITGAKKYEPKRIEIGKSDEPDKETENFLDHWEPQTKHPKEATAGMATGKVPGQKTTSTGFKLKVVKSECLKVDKNGQWAIEKSNYGPKGMGLYNPADNINRKANRTGEEVADAGQNKAVHNYTTSGASMTQAHEKAQNKVQQEKSKASVRTLADMSPEEKAALSTKYNAKIKED